LSDSAVERYVIQFWWYWLTWSTPSVTTTTAPRMPATYTGTSKAATTGIEAAAAITIAFSTLKRRWHSELLRSYQAI
jgi:hypothetical protein